MININVKSKIGDLIHILYLETNIILNTYIYIYIYTLPVWLSG